MDEFTEDEIKGSAEVEFVDFLSIAANLVKEKATMPPSDMMEAFKKFDPDNTGSVSVTMLRKVLGSAGQPPSEENMDIFLQLAEENGSGIIKYKELINKLYPQAVTEEPADQFGDELCTATTDEQELECHGIGRIRDK